jgi:hypothetical protein
MDLNLELLKLLPRLFSALDALIENYGVYLCLVFVWLALAVIAWIITGGLRKRMKGNSATVIPASSSWHNHRDNRNQQSLTSKLNKHGAMTTK